VRVSALVDGAACANSMFPFPVGCRGWAGNGRAEAVAAGEACHAGGAPAVPSWPSGTLAGTGGPSCEAAQFRQRSGFCEDEVIPRTSMILRSELQDALGPHGSVARCLGAGRDRAMRWRGSLRGMLRVAMVTVTCVAGCGGAPAGGKNSVPVEPEVARAVAFIEQPGAQSQADVDWNVIAKFGHIRFLTGVDPERGVTDQDRKSFADRLETLARTDYEAEAAREAKAFVDGWKGAEA
jgi:hypothetical protein